MLSVGGSIEQLPVCRVVMLSSVFGNAASHGIAITAVKPARARTVLL
jgi:hypothetical protein